MNRTFRHLLSCAACIGVTLAFTSCHSTSGEQASSKSKRSPTPPVAAEPLPTWATSNKRAAIGHSPRMFIKYQVKIIEVSRPPEAGDEAIKPYTRKISEAEYQRLVRTYMQKKGVDLMTSPTVFGPNGQKVTTEVIREFIYPETAGKDAKFATENTGVTSYHRARSSDGGRKIQLNTLTQVSEFTGYHEVSPDFQLPVFNRRRAEANVALEPGESVVMGGILTREEQDVEDHQFFGLIRKKSTVPFVRELVVIVTPELHDPSGKPVVASR